MGTRKLDPVRWTVLTQYFPPEVGAAQIRLGALVKRLRDRGVGVQVLTGMPNYPTGQVLDAYRKRLWSEETMFGADVFRVWLYASRVQSVWRRVLNYVSFSLTASLRILTLPNADVVFVESQPLPVGFVALMMKKLRGTRFIYNVPDLQLDVAKESGWISSSLVLRIARASENVLLRNAWKVSTVTHAFMEHFKARGISDTDITFLPNGVDTEALAPREPDRALLAELGIEGQKVILYLGTHAHYQGLDTLVDAAEIMRGRCDVTFLVAGDGPERHRLMQLSNERSLANVIFIGSWDPDDRQRLFSIADISVALLRPMEVAVSMRPAKIIPSLSCGVPVVVAADGEAARLVTDAGVGVAVSAGDSQAFAMALDRLLDDDTLRRKMGARGRALAEKEYDWSRVIDRWLDELELTVSSS